MSLSRDKKRGGITMRLIRHRTANFALMFYAMQFYKAPKAP